ncbi:hypothetical protein MRB53_006377 [Persea americana]|uniref:Uncharacterized protein n=1 Tax=Persea americana TaxID=3435 RepID=A0ACC2MG74_PERAE|nr:hypothetical protein MRB53_006377 [Persea americana]
MVLDIFGKLYTMVVREETDSEITDICDEDLQAKKTSDQEDLSREKPVGAGDVRETSMMWHNQQGGQKNFDDCSRATMTWSDLIHHNLRRG